MTNRVFKAGDSVQVSRWVQSSLWVAEDFNTVHGNVYLLEEDDDIDYEDEAVLIHADPATFWVPMAALDVVSESNAVAPALRPGRSAAVPPPLAPGRARPAPPQLQRGLAGAQEGGQEGRQATTVPESVPTPAQANADAPAAPERVVFQEGDIVRVVRRVSREEDPDYLNEWYRPGMDPLIGAEGQVTGIDYPGSGIRVHVQGRDRYGFSPLSLTRVRGNATGPEASVAAPPTTYTSPRRPAQYLVVGGVCESEVMLLLGILDKEPTAYDLLHPAWESPPACLRRLCEAAKIEAISGEEDEDYEINLAPYSYVPLGTSLTSSAVLSVPTEGVDDEGSPTTVWENRLWVGVVRVQPGEGGQVDVNLGGMCDNFFTDE